MIYQIIRFTTNRRVWGLALLSGLLLSAFYRSCPAGATAAFAGLGLFIMVAFVSVSAVQLKRYRLFETALPVRARDLFSCRVLAPVAWLWLFLLVFLGSLPYTSADASTRLAALAFEAGSILTLAHVARNAIRPAQVSDPGWWGLVVSVPAFVVMISLCFQSALAAMPAAETISILVVCWLGSVTLFLATWTALPESFQLAPKTPVAPSAQRREFWSPSLPWWTVPRALFDLGDMAYLCLLLLLGWKWDPFFGFLFSLIMLARIMTKLRIKEKWLLALPVSRHAIFAIIVSGSFGGYAVGSFLRILTTSLPAGVWCLELAAVAIALLLAELLVQIPSFASGLGSGWATVVVLAALAPVLWGSWRWFWTFETGKGRVAPIEGLFLGIPPSHLPQWIAGAAAIMAALYWLADFAFSRMEFPPQRITRDQLYG